MFSLLMLVWNRYFREPLRQVEAESAEYRLANSHRFDWQTPTILVTAAVSLILLHYADSPDSVIRPVRFVVEAPAEPNAGRESRNDADRLALRPACGIASWWAALTVIVYVVIPVGGAETRIPREAHRLWTEAFAVCLWRGRCNALFVCVMRRWCGFFCDETLSADVTVLAGPRAKWCTRICGSGNSLTRCSSSAGVFLPRLPDSRHEAPLRRVRGVRVDGAVCADSLRQADAGSARRSLRASC